MESNDWPPQRAGRWLLSARLTFSIVCTKMLRMLWKGKQKLSDCAGEADEVTTEHQSNPVMTRCPVCPVPDESD